MRKQQDLVTLGSQSVANVIVFVINDRPTGRLVAYVPILHVA